MPAVPEKLKADTWDFFVDAKSGDPTHKIPGCENLVENLIAAIEILQTPEYADKLNRCKVWSDRAHYLYYVEHDINEAVRYCNAIMRELTPMIYEPQSRFATVKSGAFKYTPEEKKNV